MNIKVRFESSLRYLADSAVMDVAVAEGADLGALLHDLVESLKRNADAIRTREIDQMAKYVAILRNGEIIQQNRYAATALSDGDVIYLVPPIAGGAYHK